MMDSETLRTAVNKGQIIVADSIESAREGDLLIFEHKDSANDWARNHFAGTGVEFTGQWTEDDIEVDGQLIPVQIAGAK